MKIQELDATTVIENPAIAARKGTLDNAHVKELAQNFAERVAAGLEHQIQPGVVRQNKGGQPEVIAGRHRLAAVKLYNSTITDGEEALPFMAVIVRATDEQGLITAITENEYRLATNIFDRAEAMQKLVDLGKTQREVAKIFGLSEGQTTQTLKAGHMPKKYQKAVLDGDLEQDAALIIASLDGSDDVRDEVFAECIRHRNKFDEIMFKRETRGAKEAADTAIAEAKEKAEKVAEEAKKAKERLAEADKAFAEKAKLSAKTKTVEELERIRLEQDAAVKAKQQAEEEFAKATKEADAAKAAIEKAKADKEKLLEKQKAAKTKVTPEQVKRIAADKGVEQKVAKKGAKSTEPIPVSKKDFIVTLETICEEKDKKTGKPLLSEAVQNLIGSIEAYLDGEKSTQQLIKAFQTHCK